MKKALLSIFLLGCFSLSLVACRLAAPGSIVFMSDRDGNGEIYVMPAPGTQAQAGASQVTRLTNSPNWEDEPCWSPDGKRIVYRSTNEIFVMNADGSWQTNLTNAPADYWFPAWSPDGKHIAFCAKGDGEVYEIRVINADGSGMTRLAGDPTWQNHPAWSPDGKRIVFVSSRDGAPEIYVMNADGSQVTRLTSDPLLPNFDPAWSPDGKSIAFCTYLEDGNREIFVMNADGSGLTNLTSDPYWDMSPSWSPDGRRIAYARVEDTDGDGRLTNSDAGEIFVMNADGSGQMNLTNNPANDLDPCWGP